MSSVFSSPKFTTAGPHPLPVTNRSKETTVTCVTQFVPHRDQSSPDFDFSHSYIMKSGSHNCLHIAARRPGLDTGLFTLSGGSRSHLLLSQPPRPPLGPSRHVRSSWALCFTIKHSQRRTAYLFSVRSIYLNQAGSNREMTQRPKA